MHPNLLGLPGRRQRSRVLDSGQGRHICSLRLFRDADMSHNPNKEAAQTVIGVSWLALSETVPLSNLRQDG